MELYSYTSLKVYSTTEMNIIALIMKIKKRDVAIIYKNQNYYRSIIKITHNIV